MTNIILIAFGFGAISVIALFIFWLMQKAHKDWTRVNKLDLLDSTAKEILLELLIENQTLKNRVRFWANKAKEEEEEQ